MSYPRISRIWPVNYKFRATPITLVWSIVLLAKYTVAFIQNAIRVDILREAKVMSMQIWPYFFKKRSITN
jgi:hypothetical protein